MGNQESDSATLTFTLGSGAWDIKVTQLECSNPAAPDNGCLQYHTGVSGRIQAFDFQTSTEAHSHNQQ